MDKIVERTKSRDVKAIQEFIELLQGQFIEEFSSDIPEKFETVLYKFELSSLTAGEKQLVGYDKYNKKQVLVATLRTKEPAEIKSCSIPFTEIEQALKKAKLKSQDQLGSQR